MQKHSREAIMKSAIDQMFMDCAALTKACRRLKTIAA